MLQIKRSELRELAQNKLGDDSIESQNKILVMISTSLAARTSYTIIGNEKEIDYAKLIDLHDRLITADPLHASPLEHCAQVMDFEEYYSFRKGKVEYIESLGWCRNFKGFKQYRYLIEEKEL